jgi:hypothetical protein
MFSALSQPNPKQRVSVSLAEIHRKLQTPWPLVRKRNYTDFATATCWRNLVPPFVNSWVSREASCVRPDYELPCSTATMKRNAVTAPTKNRHDTTILPYHDTTTPRCQDVKMQNCHDTTIPQCRDATIPQYHDTTMQRCHDTTISRCHDTMIP